MKKFLLSLLVVACSLPVFAANVDFAAVDNGDGSFTISYIADAPENAPRAIALAVDAGDATIADAAAFLTYDASYNCFMDYASQDPSSYVLSTGNAFAAPAAAGEPTYPASDFSLSMGVLDESGNQAAGPQTSTDLATVQLTQGDSDSVKVVISADTFRGGDAFSGAINGDLTTNLPIEVTVSFGGGCPGTAAFCEQWEAVGEPQMWLKSVNPYQCHGDADGQAEAGFRVLNNDLSIFLSAYSVATELLPEGAINADFDRLSEAGFRVLNNDLSIFLANYSVAGVQDNCENVTGSQE